MYLCIQSSPVYTLWELLSFTDFLTEEFYYFKGHDLIFFVSVQASLIADNNTLRKKNTNVFMYYFVQLIAALTELLVFTITNFTVFLIHIPWHMSLLGTF